MTIEEISKFLNTHNGRDKVIRTLAYTTKLAAALVSSEETVLKLETISGQLSACRTVLRFFDDIPMLNYTLTYGLGKEEPDTLSRIIGVLTNAADQLYFPLEHVAWACDHKLISLRSSPWWTASTMCWIISLYLSLIKALRWMRILQQHRSCLKGNDCDINVVMTNMLAQQHHLLLTAVRCSSDLAQAINYLPDGFLWAGKLEKWHIGVLGTVSSIISLYQCEVYYVKFSVSLKWCSLACLNISSFFSSFNDSVAGVSALTILKEADIHADSEQAAQMALILNLHIVLQNILITAFQQIKYGPSPMKTAMIHQFTVSKSSYRYMFQYSSKP